MKNINKGMSDLRHKPQFMWKMIDTQLKIKKHPGYIKIPLRSNLKIQHKQNSHQTIQTRLHVDIQKELHYQDQIGWNWHKSSNLPIISVKLQIRNIKNDTLFVPPQNLKARIYAVKVINSSIDQHSNSYLQEIGMKGQNTTLLVSGCGYFNSLRFSSTSYNNEGVQFNLLIVIYSNQKDSQIPQNIICSVLSSSIFVDSRKSARNYQQKKYKSSIQLFKPCQIQRNFVIKDNKLEKDGLKTIQNNLQGLIDYLSAPNIRHKVKHPLFLAIKFSNVFKIYSNFKSKYFETRQFTLNQVINRFQKKLIKQVVTFKKITKSKNLLKKQFIMYVESNLQKEKRIKIFEMLDYLETESVYLSIENIPDQKIFMNIQNLGDIQQVYKNQYFSLKKKSQRQIQIRKLQDYQKEQRLKKQLQQDQQNVRNKQLAGQNENLKFSQSQSLNQKRQLRHEIENNNQRYEMGIQQMYQGFEQFQRMRKRIKFSNQSLFQNRNLSLQFMKFPFQKNLQFYKFQPSNMMAQNAQNFQQNYYKIKFPFNVEKSLIKEQGQTITLLISQRQVHKKIKQMCDNVYERNKHSIFDQLQTLKKTSVNWRFRDIQKLIMTYSSALVNQIYHRQSLLRHMHLQNQILKAKVASMQQNIYSDLQGIKRNIIQMNNVLPQSVIESKLKQHNLWNYDYRYQNQIGPKIINTINLMQVKMQDDQKEGEQNKLEQPQENKDSLQQLKNNKDQLSGNNLVTFQINANKNSYQIKGQSNLFGINQNQNLNYLQPNDELSSSCHFVSNVFDIAQSPLNG